MLSVCILERAPPDEQKDSKEVRSSRSIRNTQYNYSVTTVRKWLRDRRKSQWQGDRDAFGSLVVLDICDFEGAHPTCVASDESTCLHSLPLILARLAPALKPTANTLHIITRLAEQIV